MDLISRQQAIDALGEEPLAWEDSDYELGCVNQWKSDVEAIKALPSAEPQERKTSTDTADSVITASTKITVRRKW